MKLTKQQMGCLVKFLTEEWYKISYLVTKSLSIDLLHSQGKQSFGWIFISLKTEMGHYN